MRRYLVESVALTAMWHHWMSSDQPSDGINMSTLIEVKVPDIGDFKDVPVIEICIKVGETIKLDDALVTLESDKATIDLPSPVVGVVKEIRVALGDKVSEGRIMAVLEADDTVALTVPLSSTTQIPLGELVERSFLPEKLWQKCRYLVRLIHEKYGLDALPAKATTVDYMSALACVSDTSSVMRTNALYFKLMIASWSVAAVFFVLSWVLTWWMLIGVVASGIAALWLNKRQFYGWMYLGTACLGMEILANDFCGWGNAYPDLRDRSLQLLNDDPLRPKTTWLDYYLPNRTTLSPEILRQFGPTENT